jgi:PE family
MSFVTTQPEPMMTAASDLQAIGSAVSAGNAAAAGPTTGVIPAATSAGSYAATEAADAVAAG